MKKTKVYFSLGLLILAVLDFIGMGFTVKTDQDLAPELFTLGLLCLIMGIIGFLVYRHDLKVYKRYTASLGPDANIDVDNSYIHYSYTEDYKIQAGIGLIAAVIGLVIVAFTAKSLIATLPIVNYIFFALMTLIYYIEREKKM